MDYDHQTPEERKRFGIHPNVIVAFFFVLHSLLPQSSETSYRSLSGNFPSSEEVARALLLDVR